MSEEPEQPIEPLLPRKTGLKIHEILQRMEQMDLELIEFDPNEHKDLFEDRQIGIDNLVKMQRLRDSRIEYWKSVIDEFIEVKKSLESSQERSKKYMVEIMKSVNEKTLKGKQYRITLTHNQRVEIFQPEAWIDSEIFAKYPMAIDRVFKWNKAEIKSNISHYRDIAKLEDTWSIRTGVAK